MKKERKKRKGIRKGRGIKKAKGVFILLGMSRRTKNKKEEN